MEPTARYYGRAFTLADGTDVFPCSFCGTPEFPGAGHSCEGSDWLMAENLAGPE